MKSFSLLSVFILFSLITFGQNSFKGNLKDKTTKEPLAYVNIGVVGKNIGTVSDMNGDFEIKLPEANNNDTLKMSMIGYESLTFIVSDFKKIISKTPEIVLVPKTMELKEVVISGRELKEKILGNTTESKTMTGGFSSNELGNEVGIVIKIKRSPTYIKQFCANIASNKYDSLKFRLNFYDLKDGMPNQRINNQNIILTSNIKEGKLIVDLSKYDIIMEDDFFVSLEWIENLGENGLYFSVGLLGSPIISRHTSQGNWKKIGAVSLGFNVTAKY